MPDRPWVEWAACTKHPAEWWDPPDPNELTEGNRKAIHICFTRCPVRRQCKALAATEPETWGIWAGEVHWPPGKATRRRRNWIPADSARQCLIAVVWTGWSITAVARATGIDPKKLQRIHRGQIRKLNPEHDELIVTICRRLVRKGPPIEEYGGGLYEKKQLRERRRKGKSE